MTKFDDGGVGNQEEHWRAGYLRKAISSRRDREKGGKSKLQDRQGTRARVPASLLALQWDRANKLFLRKKMFKQEAETREILRRANQHITIYRLVNVLSKDVCSLSRNSKENIDVLKDLEKRVQHLRSISANGSSSRPWADRQVDVDLMVDLSRDNTLLFKACSKCNIHMLKGVLDTHERFCHGETVSDGEHPEDGKDADGKVEGGDRGLESTHEMPRCTHCGRPFRTEGMAEHELKCSKKTKAAGNRVDRGKKGRDAATKMAPRPPRNIRVIDKTCDKVTLAWDPPIIDGGTAVHEHEVSYSVHEVVRRDNYSTEDVVTPVEPVLTSRWCLVKPIAANGFTLTGLGASSHLVNITVRCRNAVGWSDSSDILQEVFTQEPAPPGKPLFFRLDMVGSNQAVFRWKESLFKGGKEVAEYELTYTNVLPEVNQVVTSKKIEVDKHHEVRTPSIAGQDQFLVVKGLRASTLHKDITLRAIGASGMASSAVRVPDFTTLPPSRRQRILDELKRARAATGGWIDSDLYKNFLQRENRENFIAKLEQDLASLPEDESDVESSGGQAASQERRKHEEGLLEDVFKGYRRRKAQFEYRLKRLREQINEYEETRLAHIGQRVVLAQRLMTTQARVMEVQAELDRMADFKGGHINSSVVHGSQQRFPVKVLRQKLRKELKAGQASIAHDKADLVEGNKTSSRAMELKLKRAEELRERTVAFAIFNRNASRARKLAGKLQVNQNDSIAIEKSFSALVSAVQSLQRERATILNALVRMRLRFLHGALVKWKTGEHVVTIASLADKTAAADDYVIRGVGGRLLLDAEDKRRQLEGELRAAMRNVASLRKCFNRIDITNKQRRDLEGSTVFHETDLSNFLDDCEAAGLETALLAQGDGFLKSGLAASAATCYSQQIEVLGPRSDRRGLCLLGVVHARLARAQRTCDRLDFAAVSFERALELAKTANHLPGIVDALEGLGICSLDNCQDREAITLFKGALARNVEVKDHPKDARLYRALEKGYRRLVDEEHAKLYADKAEAIEKEMEAKFSKAKATLKDAATRLIGRTANSAKVVRLRRVTAGFVAMHARRASLQILSRETREGIQSHEKVVKKLEVKLASIRKQLQEALETDEDAMSSTLIVEGDMMFFDVEELKIRLREREVEVTAELKQGNDLLTSLINRGTNTADELESLDQDIEIEGGALMTSVVAKARLRLIALNLANTAGDEVEGTTTGGVEKVVAVEGKKVLVYSIASGDLMHVFSGDEPGRHRGELLGHSGVITALFFYKHTAYTGSTDCTVQVWDVRERKRLLVLNGHEATVCSVAADEDKIVSGGADKKILIWDRADGRLLRMLHGHTKSVVSLHSGPSFILSGGADGDVRFWGATKVSQFRNATISRGSGNLDADEETGRYECQRRLTGHNRSATCMSYGRLEMVSGHEDGTVIVWWLSTGMVMVKSKVHSGPVRQLQFDATNVVSCSNDGVIAVTDLTTGDCTMSLRGHEGAVLAVAFDRSKIISASDDGTLRIWVWASRGPKQDKYVALGPGDNLGRIAKQYDVTVADIVKWNGIQDPRQLGVGVRLIVQKGNPDQPTLAEAKAVRMSATKAGRAQTIKHASVRARDTEGGTERHHRSKYLTEGFKDPSQLIGRLASRDLHFAEMWQEAKRLEIVSSSADPYGDQSLAGRARHRMRIIEKEGAMFDSNSDRAEAFDFEGSNRGGSDRHEEEEEEDVLVKQARDRERVAVDISHVLTGVVVAQLVERVARDAFANSAPREAILGRVIKALDEKAFPLDKESTQLAANGSRPKMRLLPNIQQHRAPESSADSGACDAALALTTTVLPPVGASDP